jgi:ubiquinone/menaquinone biosynthesis C-methylase UbiE
MAASIRAFMKTNQEICARIERRLPQASVNLHRAYEETVARYLNSTGDGGVVVDVGGGKKCDFAKYRRPGSRVKLVAVDISAAELDHNHDVDEKRIADVTRGLPFEDGEVDLIASRSVMEHLQSSEEFIAHSARVLKRGGVSIHVFPSKFAPFSIANQLLPRKLTRRLLYGLIPGSEGVLGFPAFYDRTYASAARAMFERQGFEIAELHVGYHQAEYFDFFVPLYLLNAVYELALYTLRAENLAANVLIVARKR